MTLPRGARLEPLALTAALAALAACGSAGDSSTPAGCASCEGALCGTTCTDLSAELAAEVRAALPASACIPEATVSGADVCSAQACGGAAAGCSVELSWSPVSLGRDTHLLEGTVTATSNVDAHLSGADCTATVTATFSYVAGAAFACAAGAETASFGTITTTLESSSVTPGEGCLLATYVDQYRTTTFNSTVETTAKTALARATGSVTATCSVNATAGVTQRAAAPPG